MSVWGLGSASEENILSIGEATGNSIMKVDANGHGSPKSADGGGAIGSGKDAAKGAAPATSDSTEPMQGNLHRITSTALKEVEGRLSKGFLDRYSLHEAVMTIPGQVQCFRAVEEETGENVLAKVSLTPAGAQILGREGEMMEEVEVANTLELIENTGSHLVLEWPEKGNLADLLERGPLSLDETREIARDVFKALNDMHINGYVHEDVRAVHVWLSEDGAKLSGYGISKATDSTNARHWAPELRTRVSPPQHTLDLWAMGVLILEMLKGEALFPEDESERYRVQKKLKDPAKLTKFISENLKDLEEEEDEGDLVDLERLLGRLLDPIAANRSTARGALQTKFISPEYYYRRSRRGGGRKRRSTRVAYTGVKRSPQRAPRYTNEATGRHWEDRNVRRKVIKGFRDERVCLRGIELCTV